MKHECIAQISATIVFFNKDACICFLNLRRGNMDDLQRITPLLIRLATVATPEE